MRVLIIKTSSLGDVIHTLPAISEAGQYHPNICFDWVVEPAFAEIPRLHQRVDQIILCPMRQWRKNIFQITTWHEILRFYREIKHRYYDYIIDAQGLMKSGLLTFFSRGKRCGYDYHSAWEPLACLAYQQKYAVSPDWHAILRIRTLFAKILGYPAPEQADLCFSDYGIKYDIPKSVQMPISVKQPYCIFFHGTSRPDKLWPESHWAALIMLLKVHHKNLTILLPWGNASEKARAEKLACNQSNVCVLPQLTLMQLASLIHHAESVVAVDTGLGHLSASLNQYTISLYGLTCPEQIGTVGKNQIHIQKSTLADIQVTAVLSFLLKK